MEDLDMSEQTQRNQHIESGATPQRIKLSARHWMVSLFVFLLGLAFYFAADGKAKQWWGDDIANLLKEIGLFFSVSVLVHFLYFLFIKREELEAIVSFYKDIDQAIKQHFTKVIDGHGKLSSYGLVTAHKRLNLDDVFDLDSDEDLMILITYWSDIDNFIAGLDKALSSGAQVKILAIEPWCDNSTFRALEAGITPHSFQRRSELFIDAVADHIKRLEEPLKSKVELRLYPDLPGSPIYLIRRKDNPVRAYTGFYTSNHAKDFFHLYWEPPVSKIGDWADHNEINMLRALSDYLNKKWQRCGQMQSIPILSGEWKYDMTSDGDSKVINSGRCSITQEGRKLKIEGTRTKSGDSEYQLQWRTEWASICDDSHIRFEYLIQPQRPPSIRGFCCLEVKQGGQTNKKPALLEGYYAVCDNARDDSINTKFGKIAFKRISQEL
jgi:hypothetical protein